MRSPPCLWGLKYRGKMSLSSGPSGPYLGSGPSGPYLGSGPSGPYLGYPCRSIPRPSCSYLRLHTAIALVGRGFAL